MFGAAIEAELVAGGNIHTEVDSAAFIVISGFYGIMALKEIIADIRKLSAGSSEITASQDLEQPA